jgi:hypothetical protein
MTDKYAVKQISIFLENRKGRLLEVTEILKEAGINIRALAMAESAEFGILRLVVDNPAKAKAAITSGGFTANEQDVFAVKVDDTPGSFQKVVSVLASADINVDYAYAFVGESKSAILLFKVPDDSFADAVNAIEKSGTDLVEAVFFYA